MKQFYLYVCLVALLFASCKKEELPEVISYTQTFEGLQITANSYWKGPDKSVAPKKEMLWGQECTMYYGAFADQNASFANVYNDTWQSWSGFAYSNMTNRDSAGFRNEGSVYAASGADGSKNFGLCYTSSDTATASKMMFSEPEQLESMSVCNSTYTALSILKGDDFAKPFANGDYHRLVVIGKTKTGAITGKVEFYLADYRNGKTDLVKQWTRVDLSTLGVVSSLQFVVESSQSATPTYVCVDNIKGKKAE